MATRQDNLMGNKTIDYAGMITVHNYNLFGSKYPRSRTYADMILS